MQVSGTECLAWLYNVFRTKIIAQNHITVATLCNIEWNYDQKVVLRHGKGKTCSVSKKAYMTNRACHFTAQITKKPSQMTYRDKQKNVVLPRQPLT